jgi:hypothetical protein
MSSLIDHSLAQSVVLNHDGKLRKRRLFSDTPSDLSSSKNDDSETESSNTKLFKTKILYG